MNNDGGYIVYIKNYSLRREPLRFSRFRESIP